MNITVNGKILEIETSITVDQLLHQINLGNERVAVEHNKHILESDEYAAVVLKDGDILEVVRFVGGG